MSEIEQSPSDGLAADPQQSGGVWKWWLAGVLFLATVLTYLDRQTMAVCKEYVSSEFRLNNEQYGDLLAAFRWTYALMQPLAGLMADHFSLRLTYGLAVGLWSLAGAAAALAFRFPLLLITRGVLGMGECFNWPCASRIVANAFPPRDRSLASGIFNSGAAVGALISTSLIGFLAFHFGWRWAFFTMGASGALWLVLWIAISRRRGPCYAVLKGRWNLSQRGQWIFAATFLGVGIALPAVVFTLGPRLVAPLVRTWFGACETWPALPTCVGLGLGAAALIGLAWSLTRWRRGAVGFWMLILVTLTVNPCWYFVNEWLFAYLRDSRQLDLKGAIMVQTAVFLVADLGNLISGAIIKLLVGRGWSLRAARSSVMIGIALAVTPVCLVTQIESTLAACVLLALAGIGLTGIIANSTACQQDLSFRRVGAMSGIVGMLPSIVSAVANPRIGAHIDRTHSYSLLFLLLGLLPLVSVAAILVFDSVIHGKKT